MYLVPVLRVPLMENLQGLLALLQDREIPCRVVEASGEQELWAPEERTAEVQWLYQQQKNQPAQVSPSPNSAALNWRLLGRQLAQLPVTVGVLLLCLLLGLLTGLGENFQTLRWLTFTDFWIQGEYLYLAGLEQTLSSGEWWRLLSPTFIHIGGLHLCMNLLWFWVLGQRIEQRQGGLWLLGLTLLLGLLANWSQYIYADPGLFGGLSGVLYGLLGYCVVMQWLVPRFDYRLPRGVVVMMLVWLLICLSGAVELLSLGSVSVANAAHVGGLLGGLVLGGVAGLVLRCWKCCP